MSPAALPLSTIRYGIKDSLLGCLWYVTVFLEALALCDVLILCATGIAVRLWALGIEMRPLFTRREIWIYPLYAGIGGSFGYWLQGIERKQNDIIADRIETLLEKRRRQLEREGRAPEERAAAYKAPELS